MTTLMMIDDEELFLKSMSRYFESRGYRVIADSNAERALAVFHDRPEAVDLIILDHDMPDCSGRECLQRIQARRPNIPVIVMSGYPPECLQAEAYKSARIILPKPMELADIEAAVLACLAGS